MKKIMLSLVAVASLASAASAFAQPYSPPPGAPMERPMDRPMGPPPMGRPDMRVAGDISQRIAQLDARIDQGQRNGALRGREVRGLRNQLQQVRWMEQRDRERSGGRLNDRQRFDLNARLDRIAGQLRFERQDGPGRY